MHSARSDCPVAGVALRLDVNSIESEGVLAHDDIYTIVTSAANDLGSTYCAASVPHCKENVHHQSLEECGFALKNSIDKIVSQHCFYFPKSTRDNLFGRQLHLCWSALQYLGGLSTKQREFWKSIEILQIHALRFLS